MRLQPAFVLALLLGAAAVPLATFGGEKATSFKWREMNDPVMGGRSSGSFRVNETEHFGVFNAEIRNVPSLRAPGFAKAYADGKFPNASGALGGDLVLLVRSSTPEYKGFRVSFASTMTANYACASGGTLPFSGGCFKADFTVPPGDRFVPVRIPLNTFTDRWSPQTGNARIKCSANPTVCPTAKRLGAITRVEVWAEGYNGVVHLEIKSVSIVAVKATLGGHDRLNQGYSSPRPPADQDSCKGQIQPNLRYGISRRMDPTVPIPVNPTETLAEAVCCDKRTTSVAEPQFLFAAPDVMMFSQLRDGQVTTFYDAVCGRALFRTPVNRTLDDFKDDTNEHGWPSFRAAEVIHDNVITDKASGMVTSVCGTHLGSYLPDQAGPRWCIDLSCIAGNPAVAEI